MNEAGSKRLTRRKEAVSVRQVLIVTTLSGEILGINKDSGNILWYRQDSLGPVVKITDKEGEPDHINVSTDQGVVDIEDEDNDLVYEAKTNELSIPAAIPQNDKSLTHHDGDISQGICMVEPFGEGNLYQYSPGSSHIKKLPFSMKKIVDDFPSYVSADHSTMYTGDKTTRLLAINPLSGSILASYGDAPYDFSDADLDEEKSNPIRVYLGRTQYSLKISSNSGKVQQEILYGEFTTANPRIVFNKRNHHQDQLLKTQIGVGSNGELLYRDKYGSEIWHTKLNSPASAVFEIVKLNDAGYTLIKAYPALSSFQNKFRNIIKKTKPVFVGNVDGSSFILPLDFFDSEFLPGKHSNPTHVADSPKKTLLIDAPLCSPYPECFDSMVTFIENNRAVNAFNAINEYTFKSNFNTGLVSLWVLFTVYIISRILRALLFGRSTHQVTGIDGENDTKTEYNLLGKSVDTLIDDSIQKELPSIPIDALLVSEQVTETVEEIGGVKLRSLEVSEKILGYGSHGTVVYQGKFEGRSVAIKRLLVDFYDIAHNEVQLLQDSDSHPNVIRYFYKEQSEKFLYVALELAPCSLYDVIEKRTEEIVSLRNRLKYQSVLYQIMQGLKFLHSLKIVHRDIKPQNILIGELKGNKLSHPRILISDFGLCKKLADDQSSFNNTVVQGGGTIGWRAPECFSGVKKTGLLVVENDSSFEGATDLSPYNPIKITRKIDIFSAGCVFYFMLSGGEHPYGDRFSREINIIKGNFRLDKMHIMGEEEVEAKDLIRRMLSKDPKKRPEAGDVLIHPFFWTPSQRLSFLQDVSDRYEVEEREPPSNLLKQLERGANKIIGNDWHRKLDRSLLDDLSKYRKYDGSTIRDLLRALRNKKHHYQDLPDNLKKALGSLPEGFLSYFTGRFPNLLMHVHSVVAVSSIRNEPQFGSYFQVPVDHYS